MARESADSGAPLRSSASDPRRVSGPRDLPRPTRSLHPDIELLGKLDRDALDDLWDRFEVFEALHHSLAICNPMTSHQLDEVVEAAGAVAGHHVLDLACGSGEYLLRTAQRTAINGSGIDLSPWMISRAHRRAVNATTSLSDGSTLRWVLGDAASHEVVVRPDIAICVGAEWVWHDFRGTARALAAMVDVGGIAVIGAARLHCQANPEAVLATHGAIETIDDMAASLAEVGLTPLHRVDPTDSGWDAYLAQTRVAVNAWQRRHPGARSEQWVIDQSEWWAARQRDRGVIGWSVWIAQKSLVTE